jgi:hypothetical protein
MASGASSLKTPTIFRGQSSCITISTTIENSNTNISAFTFFCICRNCLEVIFARRRTAFSFLDFIVLLTGALKVGGEPNENRLGIGLVRLADTFFKADGREAPPHKYPVGTPC